MRRLLKSEAAPASEDTSSAARRGLVREWPLPSLFAAFFLTACSASNSGSGTGADSGSTGSNSSSGGSGASSGSGTTGSDSSGTSSSGSSSGGSGSSDAGAQDGTLPPAGNHYYVSPTGTGTSCSQAAPCSITQAKTAVSAAAATASSDIVVELAGGTYRLTAPLVFTEADSPANGHTVTWQAASGAATDGGTGSVVLSGGLSVTGWTKSDMTKNIWKASAPGTFATRQLYVDGKVAQRSNVKVNINGASHTSSSFSLDSAAQALNGASDANRVDLHSYRDWSDHYAPVKSISNGMVTMVEPAWFNNTWGYDTIAGGQMFGPGNPNSGFGNYLENAYELLSSPAQWYQDVTGGFLYYIPLAGQDMSTADVELPQVEAILVVAGSSYTTKAHDLTFSGLTFEYSSWLGPSTNGYADQQSNAFIDGDGTAVFDGGLTDCAGSTCVAWPNNFESTRAYWWIVPAAVQVSVAKNISFLGDRFVNLGSGGLGIGEDNNAHVGKLGLGADTITVKGCVFKQLAGPGIVAGGIGLAAHHPCGNAVCGASDPGTPMINQNITISDNFIHDFGQDFIPSTSTCCLGGYADSNGIEVTFVANAIVSHNEIFNGGWSGMQLSWGWGSDNQGGSDDYAGRGIYNYQPRYTVPTTSTNNMITDNYIHDVMTVLGDGAYVYLNGELPHGTLSGDYHVHQTSGPLAGFTDDYGFSCDEGTNDIAITGNVFDSFQNWAGLSGSLPSSTTITVTNNWYNAGSSISNAPGSSTVMGNAKVSGNSWPAGAQAVISAAGLEASYAYLKTDL